MFGNEDGRLLLKCELHGLCLPANARAVYGTNVRSLAKNF
jgi:hypothetical protein